MSNILCPFLLFVWPFGAAAQLSCDRFLSTRVALLCENLFSSSKKEEEEKKKLIYEKRDRPSENLRYDISHTFFSFFLFTRIKTRLDRKKPKTRVGGTNRGLQTSCNLVVSLGQDGAG